MSEPYTFELISSGLPALTTSSANECLLQWNLDPSILDVKTFRLFGPLSGASTSKDFENLVAAFLESPAHRGNFEVLGDVTLPISAQIFPLASTVVSMSFFERIKESDTVLSPAGNIRGCFEESFDGIIVNDCLREMLVYALLLLHTKLYFSNSNIYFNRQIRIQKTVLCFQ
jgi:hypothetical protein